MEPYALTVTLNAAVDTTYMLEGFAVGGIHAVAELKRAAGGKGNNVARVLRVLGVPVVATGFAGGSTGAMIEADLRASGITADYEPIPGESRVCLTMVDRVSQSITEVREKGPVIPPGAAAAFVDRFRRLLAGAGALVLSGSLPPGLPPDFYARLVSAARAAGVRVLLDSSGDSLRQALAAGPDLVKPNREELAAWAGSTLHELTASEGSTLRERSAVALAARRMQAAGAGAVAVSLGKEGLIYVGRDAAWIVNAPPVEAVNTVGSGDSLVAGLIAGLIRGMALPDVLRLGVACGTTNALTAAVASPRTADIETILALVSAEPFA